MNYIPGVHNGKFMSIIAIDVTSWMSKMYCIIVVVQIAMILKNVQQS